VGTSATRGPAVAIEPKTELAPLLTMMALGGVQHIGPARDLFALSHGSSWSSNGTEAVTICPADRSSREDAGAE
jgi:hypothetical protein